MSIQTEIDRINTGVAAAYAVLEGMGATMPDTQNVDNLAATALAVPTGGVEIAKLWENADDTSTFVAQTIALGLSEYDAISIYYKGKTNSTVYLSTGLIPVGRDFTLYYMTSDPASQRRAGSVSTTGITFASGFDGSAASDACAIPVIIYGHKGIVDVGLEAAKLYELPHETTFPGTEGQTIFTGIKLFDTPKDFTIFVDVTADYTQRPRNVFSASRSPANEYVGGVSLRTTYDWMGGYGLYVGGWPDNGSANVFPTVLTTTRTKLAIVYEQGLPSKQYYCREDNGIITVNDPSNLYGSWTYTANDNTFSIGGNAGGYEPFTGTIHALELYGMVLPEKEINKRLAF